MRPLRLLTLVPLCFGAGLGCGGKSAHRAEPTAADAWFVPLETIPDALHTEWAALSGDGLNVVGTASLPSAVGVAKLVPMVWDETGRARELRPKPEGDSKLLRAGNGPILLGGITTALGSYQPFLWRDGDIQIVPTKGSLDAMTPDARWIVGSYLYIPDFVHGYRWSEATDHLDLGTLEELDHSSAAGISDDGRIVVGKSGERAYSWTEDRGMRALALPAGTAFSDAVDLSQDGSVIAGSARASDSSRQIAVRWLDGEPEELEALPGQDHSRAFALSADGSVVVGESGEAVLWFEGGVRSVSSLLSAQGVDLSGFELSAAIDVSLNGRVVLGIGEYQGEARAWLAQLALPP